MKAEDHSREERTFAVEHLSCAPVEQIDRTEHGKHGWDAKNDLAGSE
jgi:hypothetical protein